MSGCSNFDPGHRDVSAPRPEAPVAARPQSWGGAFPHTRVPKRALMGFVGLAVIGLQRRAVEFGV